MPRRAGDARSGGTPRLCWRSPAGIRTPPLIATGTGVFSEAVARAGGVMRPGAVHVAWDAAPRQRMEEDLSRPEHLAVDHHRQKEEREVQQRKLVYPPGRLRPVGAHAHTNDSHEQNPTENDRGDEVDDAQGAEGEWQ